ncbi:MAG: hypothetical protein IPG61_08415 [bacterium]|nr:hypothetical protein [bacterium]
MIWLVGGIIVTVGSFAVAEDGGSYVVAWGAIAWGVIQVLRGLVGIARSSREHADPSVGGIVGSAVSAGFERAKRGDD